MVISRSAVAAAAVAALALPVACAVPIDAVDRRHERLVPMTAYLSPAYLCPANDPLQKRWLGDEVALSATFDRQTATLAWNGRAAPLHAPMTGGRFFFASHADGVCTPGETLARIPADDVVQGQAALTPVQAVAVLDSRLHVQLATADYPGGTTGGTLRPVSHLDERSVQFYHKDSYGDAQRTGAVYTEIYGDLDTTTGLLTFTVQESRADAPVPSPAAIRLHAGRSAAPAATKADILSSAAGNGNTETRARVMLGAAEVAALFDERLFVSVTPGNGSPDVLAGPLRPNDVRERRTLGDVTVGRFLRGFGNPAGLH